MVIAMSSFFVFGEMGGKVMARPTREEININALILSYELDPDGVYHVTRYMCNRAKTEYAALMTPWTKMSEEEIIRDKQEIRYQLLQIALENEDDAIKQQMVFVHRAIRAPWLWDKIKILLDQVARYGEGDIGNLYRSILVKEYFSDFPKNNWQVADVNGVSEGVVEYRKREAIKLFGVLIWKYCEERENEDIRKGVIIRDDR